MQNVQLSDDTTTVVAWFSGPQPALQNYAALADNDPRYLAWQAAALIAYAGVKQARVSSGGISVNVGSGGSPLAVEASTDTASLVLLQGAASQAQSNSGATFSWVQKNGAPVTLTAAQVLTIFAAVTTFIQSTFTTLAAVIAAIGAGTITSTAQIDTLPAGVTPWPVNS